MNLSQLYSAMLGRDFYMAVIVETLLGRGAADVLQDRLREMDALILETPTL